MSMYVYVHCLKHASNIRLFIYIYLVVCLVYTWSIVNVYYDCEHVCSCVCMNMHSDKCALP